VVGAQSNYTINEKFMQQYRLFECNLHSILIRAVQSLEKTLTGAVESLEKTLSASVKKLINVAKAIGV
jgi:hypothetical protein